MKRSVVKSTGVRPLTTAQKKEIQALQQVPDSEIDYSEIPPLRSEFWKHAIRNPFHKRQVTIRLDADVLSWLRSHGKGYQTRINALLRQMMLADQRDAIR